MCGVAAIGSVGSNFEEGGRVCAVALDLVSLLRDCREGMVGARLAEGIAQDAGLREKIIHRRDFMVSQKGDTVLCCSMANSSANTWTWK